MHNKNFHFGSSSSGGGNDNARSKLPIWGGSKAGGDGNGRNTVVEGEGHNTVVEGNRRNTNVEGDERNSGADGEGNTGVVNLIKNHTNNNLMCGARDNQDLAGFQVEVEARPPPKAKRETWTAEQNIAVEKAYEEHRNDKGEWEKIMQVPILKGHPKKSVQAKVREIKMSRSMGQAPGEKPEDKGKKWSKEQDQALNEAYSKYGNNLSQIMQDPLLKGRPLRGIKAKIAEIAQAKPIGQQPKILGSSSAEAPKFPIDENETIGSTEAANCPINQTQTAGVNDKDVPGVPNLSLELLMESEYAKMEKKLCSFMCKNVGLVVSQVFKGNDMKEALSESVSKVVQTELTEKSVAQILQSDEFKESICTCMRKVVREEMKKEN